METPEPSQALEDAPKRPLARLKNWGYRNRWLVAMGVLVLGFYFVLDPARFSPVPPCPLHTMTGLECPGCGGQRALHVLLRGDLAAAWGFNPLVPLAIPLLGILMARRIVRSPEQYATPQPLALWKIVVVLLLLVAFTVYRNLPA